MQYEIELTADDELVLKALAETWEAESDVRPTERGWKANWAILPDQYMVYNWRKLLDAGLIEKESDCARYRITGIGIQTHEALKGKDPEPVEPSPDDPIAIFMAIHAMLNEFGIEQGSSLTNRIKLALHRMKSAEENLIDSREHRDDLRQSLREKLREQTQQRSVILDAIRQAKPSKLRNSHYEVYGNDDLIAGLVTEIEQLRQRVQSLQEQNERLLYEQAGVAPFMDAYRSFVVTYHDYVRDQPAGALIDKLEAITSSIETNNAGASLLEERDRLRKQLEESYLSLANMVDQYELELKGRQAGWNKAHELRRQAEAEATAYLEQLIATEDLVYQAHEMVARAPAHFHTEPWANDMNRRIIRRLFELLPMRTQKTRTGAGAALLKRLERAERRRERAVKAALMFSRRWLRACAELEAEGAEFDKKLDTAHNAYEEFVKRLCQALGLDYETESGSDKIIETISDLKIERNQWRDKFKEVWSAFQFLSKISARLLTRADNVLDFLLSDDTSSEAKSLRRIIKIHRMSETDIARRVPPKVVQS
jgi:hypothetical protein